MKALFINGSPRKKWNTDQMIDQAIKGAESLGVTCEKIHLYDYSFKGCVSCFACKIKNSRSRKSTGMNISRRILRPLMNSDGRSHR